MYLASHLIFSGFTAFFAEYPTVPKGQSRVRLALHSCNTEEQIDKLIGAVNEWLKEMIEIEDGVSNQKLPKAARSVFELEKAVETNGA
jgi:8-amino-7-oxononanoate synthase